LKEGRLPDRNRFFCVNGLSAENHKLGPDVRGTLYIQLANFSNHYLVLVVTDERFQYALITTRILTESMYASMVLEDIAWLDVSRIHEDPVVKANPDKTAAINRRLEGHDQMVEGSSKHRFSGYVKPPISNFIVVTVV